jgi:hypothetical protein
MLTLVTSILGKQENSTKETFLIGAANCADCNKA